jgi:hypothetical protein
MAVMGSADRPLILAPQYYAICSFLVIQVRSEPKGRTWNITTSYISQIINEFTKKNQHGIPTALRRLHISQP